MDAQTLRTTLRKIQEPKGYFFNADEKMTLALMDSLLTNKDRYGYMVCPCRLASGNYEADKDIICPCNYRTADVEEYGTCFCGLYVSKDWNEGKVEHHVVPERRPPEKLMAALGMTDE
ncbi:ferredoxin-thioredoxin reductase catalytic domain-containing protein [Desulfovibrio inopinatus]|uniref:ferredoxin-thioredoxin reductase catalytic domain-containing protein n=1 Tax=Desulfovibrio inopinatus TaxID=102109 RepID=UPI00041CAC46|nr:ferredoxin-thioredoxin reductase catalytic domain-containing protein [Desulfovibrio inopinatus]